MFRAAARSSALHRVAGVQMFLPWDEVKVTLLRLQTLAEELPAQVQAPPFAGCAAHGGGPGGSRGHLQRVAIITVTEQLRAQRGGALA